MQYIKHMFVFHHLVVIITPKKLFLLAFMIRPKWQTATPMGQREGPTIIEIKSVSTFRNIMLTARRTQGPPLPHTVTLASQ